MSEPERNIVAGESFRKTHTCLTHCIRIVLCSGRIGGALIGPASVSFCSWTLRAPRQKLSFRTGHKRSLNMAIC